MRAQHPTAGGGYEPYDPYDDCDGSEDGYGYEAEQEGAAAAADNIQEEAFAAPSEAAVGAFQAGPTVAAQKTDKLSSSSSSSSSEALQSAGQLGNYSIKAATDSKVIKQLSLQQQQAPAGTAAAAGGGSSWSIAAGCDADEEADHFSSGSEDGCSCSSSSSSSSAERDTDGQQQQLNADPAAAAAAAAWLAEPPPVAWLSGAGSYRLALHTSSKHGAGTRTRVSP
jgi:hypothetical protein